MSCSICNSFIGNSLKNINIDGGNDFTFQMPQEVVKENIISAIIVFSGYTGLRTDETLISQVDITQQLNIWGRFPSDESWNNQIIISSTYSKDTTTPKIPKYEWCRFYYDNNKYSENEFNLSFDTTQNIVKIKYFPNKLYFSFPYTMRYNSSGWYSYITNLIKPPKSELRLSYVV